MKDHLETFTFPKQLNCTLSNRLYTLSMEQPIDTSNLDQGLDRDQILKLKKRFLAISDERLARTRLSLSDRQQLVLDALPALFHFNHPGLPGYVSHQTPAGLCQYKVNNRSKLALKRLSRSFNCYDPNLRDDNIYAIFIMGSVGSIAHGSRSDLDVWICHKPGLGASDVRLISHKGERISRWAMTQGLEVHCFTMDCDAFRSGQAEHLDDESSGSSQHYLLLDEFYRTAIWLGGRIPLWWFVPAELELDYQDYAQILLEKQFVRPNEVLDFGSAAKIPAGEYVGAGIWHLYKGIDSPYKSVLKLLLLESYVSQFPDVDPLSIRYKRQVYSGETNLDHLDAYVSLYQHLEHYLLKREEHKRLELVRRAFYFKVHCPLTQAPGNLGWQWQLLRSLVQQWRWSKSLLEHLDTRKSWKAAEVKLEKHHLVYELIGSYRFLSRFAAHNGAKNRIDQQELETLGHKLHAAFDRKAGKIEFINPDISTDISEPFLLVRHQPQRPAGERWACYALPDRRSPHTRNQLVKHSANLNELLCWCLLNQIYRDDSDILVEGGSTIDSQSIKQFLSSITACLPTPLPKPNHKEFLQPAIVNKLVIFANLLSESNANTGAYQLNNERDAFCFGEQHDNLLKSVEMVSINSWNEVICQSFTDDPLIEMIQRYLQIVFAQRGRVIPDVTIFCRRGPCSSVISARLHEFFSDLNQTLANEITSSKRQQLNFLFEAGGQFHLFRGNANRGLVDSFASFDKIRRALQKPNNLASVWALDSRCLVNHPLRLVLRSKRAPGIKVYIEPTANISANLYFLDDLQNLTVLSFACDQLQYLMQSLHRFIRRIIKRDLSSHFDSEQSFGVYPVSFFLLRKVGTRWSHCESLTIDTHAIDAHHFDVEAIALADHSEEQLHYRLTCDQQELHGDQREQIKACAQLIEAKRRGGDSYPCYLSDLDLSHCRNQLAQGGELLLGDYLRIKHQLEQQIQAQQSLFK